MSTIDLGYDDDSIIKDTKSEDVTDIETGDVGDKDGNKSTLDSEPDDDNTDGNSGDDDGDSNGDGDDNNDNNETSKYEEGTKIEVDGEQYTIDKDGNALDKDGNVFKESKEIDSWLESMGDDDDIVGNVIKLTDIIITDDEDKPLEYDDTPEGIASYIKDVIENVEKESKEYAINSLYEEYPFVKNMINYYVSNGNSLDGYENKPDRSSIEISVDDTAQQESIVKEYWKINKLEGDVNDYIKYLKDTNNLLDTATKNLKNLVEKDKKDSEAAELEANRIKQEREQMVADHWNEVKRIVDSKSISGYQLPDKIVRNVDGKKVTSNTSDFFNYIYLQDSTGKTAYQKAIENKDKTDKINNELLAAYIEFCGGDYSSIIKMKENENNVKVIKKKVATARSSSRVRVEKPGGDSNKPMDFGYND